MSSRPVQWTDLKAVVVDATGTELTAAERDVFAAEKPAGFILFKRNCVSRQQVKELVASVREVVGFADLPVLIDQEGGTVARLRQPEWTEYPAAKIFGELTKQSKETALEATRINSYLMALDLIDMGINVNCAPVMDVPAPDCHEFLSASRTYSDSADTVAQLGEAVCRGLLDAGVTPVIKHIPGHGRAKVDSHFALPVAEATAAELSQTDFKPFTYMSGTDIHRAVWAMAAHVLFPAYDAERPATLSPVITEKVIRGEMGFDGVLIADDVSMKALGGTIQSRIEGTMAAGMDMTMICNASFEDRVITLQSTPKVGVDAARRLQAATAGRSTFAKKGNDNGVDALRQRLAEMIAPVGGKVAV